MSNDNRRSEQPEPVDTPEQILDTIATWGREVERGGMTSNQLWAEQKEALADLDRYYKVQMMKAEARGYKRGRMSVSLAYSHTPYDIEMQSALKKEGK